MRQGGAKESSTGVVCVTGCAGFIGSHLCERLLALGATVVGIDSFDDFYDPAIKRRNLNDCLGKENFHLVEGDIRELDFLEKTFRHHRPKCVIHLAARAGVRPSIENPLLYEDVNIRGTLSLLEAARRQGVVRFLFGSSSSVYGSSETIPFSEAGSSPEPISPYGATKLAGEALCGTYHRLYGIDMVCLRFFTVYGPRQRPEMAIHKFTRLLWEGKPIPRFGDGSTSRDYTYVGDIIDGLVAGLKRPAGFQIINLGNSRPISLAALIDLIGKSLGRPVRLEPQPEQPGDAKRTHADIAKAGKMLGYEPQVTLEDGIAAFIKWFRRQREP